MNLAQLTATVETQLLETFPESGTILPPLSASSVIDEQLPKTLKSVQQSERSSIFAKLRQQKTTPITAISEDELLYLEQQLSDLLGFALTTETTVGRLPYLVGQIQAEPHHKRNPNTQLSDLDTILEAGLRQRRGYLGWQSEEYGVSLPFQEVSQWTTATEPVRTQLLHQKVVVINPLSERAILASITDVGPAHTQRFQFGGTPNLIRAGQFWNPGCSGLAAVFFLESSQSHQKNGLLHLGK